VSSVSVPVLALSYWLHLIATIVWIGGLALMALVVWPAAQRALDAPQRAALMEALNRRFAPLAYLSLGVLIVTGMIQLVGDENYLGTLQFTNAWSQLILVKHIFVGAMIAVSVYMSLSIEPALRRLALLEARRPEVVFAEMDDLRRRRARLTQVNFGCGIVVLLVTAVATAL
jgi:uncharacterized membrane protein